MGRLIKLLFFSIIIASFLVGFPVFSETPTAATQAQLEQELKEVEQQIATYQKQLSATTNTKQTLANKIKQLQIKQYELVALIKAANLQMTKIGGNINSLERDIKNNLARQEKLKVEMAAILRLINRQNSTIVVVLASEKGLSSVFRDVQNYTQIFVSLDEVAKELQGLKKDMDVKMVDLEDQKDSTENLLKLKTIQNAELAGTLKEQGTLLAETKGLERNYANALANSKKHAAEIRNRIYELFNTGSQVTFGQAVDIANLTSKLTGIRPAYILAVLTQESNLGKNVGTCNRKGDPPEKSWKAVMKPDRDQGPFKTITTELGLDIDTTPVSCPMHGKDGSQIGWGGAMGPAQFIPSTWMGYRSKVTAVTGKATANPWDIRDAFIAAAIKLKAGGANGTRDGEWKAAMIYFAGSVKTQYSFYGDNVMALADKYDKDITALSN